MNTNFLIEQIESEKSSTKYKEQIVYNHYPSLIGFSKRVWGYFGYAGLLTPWHDVPNLYYKTSQESLYKFIQFLADENISLESYSMFCLSIASHDRFERPAKLFSNTCDRSCMKKLRRYADSIELLDEAAYILMRFLELQVDHKNKAIISRENILKRDEETKSKYFMEGFHRLVDRVRQLREYGVDPEIWLVEKFKRSVQFFPKDHVKFRTIVNINGVDPDLNVLKSIYGDPWREIRQFLGLSFECQFPDNYIPKGWAPSGDDKDLLNRIAKITGDGYYYYEDGTQRKGKRHYLSNSYFVVKCDPSNFPLFKGGWNDPRMLSVNPTFEEYFKFGAYPDIWDMEGNATNGRGKSVRWRK